MARSKFAALAAVVVAVETDFVVAVVVTAFADCIVVDCTRFVVARRRVAAGAGRRADQAYCAGAGPCAVAHARSVVWRDAVYVGAGRGGKLADASGST